MGLDNPLVAKVLAEKSPSARALELVSGTKLGDPKVRKKLAEGGTKAIAASDDTMIKLARDKELQGRLSRGAREREDLRDVGAGKGERSGGVLEVARLVGEAEHVGVV